MKYVTTNIFGEIYGWFETKELAEKMARELNDFYNVTFFYAKEEEIR